MICLFEDKKDALLSAFVRVAMQSQIKCFYSDGSSNLKNSLMSIHNAHPEEFVIVYCDLVPNNRNTKKTFLGLWDFIQRTSELHGKAFIAPSYCTEYYYLKSLEKYGLVDTDCRDVVSLCMSLKPYLENAELSKWKRDEFSTHEKLCKLLCKVAVRPCASTITKGNHHYIQCDCLCDTESDFKCVEATVYEKSCRVADEWRFKADGWGNKPINFNVKDAVDELMNMLDEFNKLANEYELQMKDKHKTLCIDIKSVRRMIYASFKDF